MNIVPTHFRESVYLRNTMVDNIKNKQRNLKKLLTRYFVAMNCSLTDQGLSVLLIHSKVLTDFGPL